MGGDQTRAVGRKGGFDERLHVDDAGMIAPIGAVNFAWRVGDLAHIRKRCRHIAR